MTQAQYARHRNKSPQYIGKLYKAGILVMRGRWWTWRRPTPCSTTSRPEKTTMDGQPPASYAQARLADMVFRAKLRRLEFEIRQGKLRGLNRRGTASGHPTGGGFAISPDCRSASLGNPDRLTNFGDRRRHGAMRHP